MTLAPTATRVLVILLAMAGAAGQVAHLDALWWHALGLTRTVAQTVAPHTRVILGAHAIVALVCAVLSVRLVLSERQHQVASRALAVAFGAWAYLQAYPGVTLLFRPPVPGMERDLFEAHFLVVEMLGLVGLVRFSAVFPRELLPDELLPSPTLPAPLAPFHHAAVRMRLTWAPWLVGGALLLVSWGLVLATGGVLSDTGLHPFTHLIRFFAAGLVVMNLTRAWSVATEGDRDGMAWLFVALAYLLGSVALLIGGNILVAVTGWPEPDIAWRPVLLDLGSIGLFTSLALSVLHRHASDPRRMIHRIATGTVVVTAGLFLAAGLEALFGGGALSGITLRRGIGTAVAFAVVMSTWRSFERLLDRVLPV